MAYLTDIHVVKTPIHFYCNAGHSSTNKKEKFILMDMWCNPRGKENIIPLQTIKVTYRVTYVINDHRELLQVYTPARVFEFFLHAHGLH